MSSSKSSIALKSRETGGKVKKEPASISNRAINRLPYYLKYLKKIAETEGKWISASAMASDLGIYEVSVRKDLAAVSSTAGKPRVGFEIEGLIADIESFLGYDCRETAILAGAGHLGKAILNYLGSGDELGERGEYGLRIVSAFDTDPSLHGKTAGGCEILPVERMADICAELGVSIGIITVPHHSAQDICDMMVRSGIKAVWNFAPTLLSVPKGILVQSENMAASAAILSKHIAEAKRH